MDYYIYLENINFLELSFLKNIFKNIDKFDFCDVEKFFIQTNNFFNLLRNYSALSYLQDYIDREKILFSDYILSSLKSSDRELFKYVNYFLNLTENFLNYLTYNDNKFQEKVYLANIENRIETIDKKHKKEKILKLLNNLNEIIEQIVVLKEEENYLLLIEKYNEFIKNSLMFLSFLITNLTAMEIKKLKLDPLTKTLTRASLEGLILGIEDVSIVSQKPFAIAFIDIDNFKKVNDTYDHLAGDEVLKNIASTIKNKIRLSDYLFRYGGEEFIIVFSAIKDINTLKNKLEEIREAVASKEINFENFKINVTVSVGGLFVKLKNRVPVKNLIEKADKLMYTAKKSGKNRAIVDKYIEN
ncbi:GGDEF domain-containing protein [Lebetimonas sp. JH292]|uniref:GGDEF domain-containing protein n=1 Tax=Lebetimonas sp. JH292 TaxID=990068 RepID=UPI0004654431|nr:GGDEF domain-containing protein [Lebetimonas sp. JH292]